MAFLAGVASPQQQQCRRPDPANIRATYDRKPHEANCSSTPASKHLSHQLQIVMHILQLKDNELYDKTGIRRCWFIRRMDDVFREIKL